MIVQNQRRQRQRKREHRTKATLEIREGVVQAFPWIRKIIIIMHSWQIFPDVN